MPFADLQHGRPLQADNVSQERPRVSFADNAVHDDGQGSRSTDSRSEPPRSPSASTASSPEYSPEYSPQPLQEGYEEEGGDDGEDMDLQAQERSDLEGEGEDMGEVERELRHESSPHTGLPPPPPSATLDSMDSKSTSPTTDLATFSPAPPRPGSPRAHLMDVEEHPLTNGDIRMRSTPVTPTPPSSPPPDNFDEALFAKLAKLDGTSTRDDVELSLTRNHRLLNAPSTRLGTSACELVDEIMDAAQLERCLEKHETLRMAMVSRFSQCDMVLNDSIQRLRSQYKALNDQWLSQCQRLDRLDEIRKQKQAALAAAEEATVVSGRSSRRNNLGLFADAVRSDLEMEQVIATLGNEDLTDPNFLAIRNTAIIPDMISVTDRWEEDCKYDDLNGIVADPEKFFDPYISLGHWSEEEQQIFQQQYAAAPKQFGRIAKCLPHKTAEQCVLFYYLNKQQVNFRALLARNGGGRGRRGGGRRGGKQKGNALLADIRRPQGEEDEDSPQTPSEYTPRRRRAAAEPAKPPSSRSRTGETSGEARRGRGGRPRQTLREEPPTREQSLALQDGNADEDDDEDKPPAKKTRARRKPRADPEKEAPRRRGTTSSYWSVQDKADFLRGLHTHGKSWPLIAQVVQGKTPVQVRNYFQNHAEELGLHQIVRERLARIAREGDESTKADSVAPAEVSVSL